MDKPIRVVIVDDHQVVLDGFMARLEMEPELTWLARQVMGLKR